MTSPILGTLTEEVAADVGAMQSATTLINGFGARLQAAVEAALAAGATAEELAPVSDLVTELAASRVALAEAVAANPG